MRRGEIWELALPGQPEDAATHPRQVVLLSSDALGVLPLRIVVPLRPWDEKYRAIPWMVRVPPVLNSGLESVAAADTLQVTSLPAAQLARRVGELPDNLVAEISAAVALVIESAAP